VADPSKRPHKRKSPYTADRGIPGAYEGETVTRRALFSGGAAAAGGVATAAFALPALGFALGPIFKQQEGAHYEDVGAEADFNPQTYVPKVMTLVPDVGEPGKTTVYIRRRDPARDTKLTGYPYVAISTRCAHLGCPVRYVQAAERFICPCHGGVYSFDGKVSGGPPVRPLDRFQTKVVTRGSGARAQQRVLVGPRFSVNSHLEKFSPRDPSNHLDGLWQYLYPSRFSTTR
jgi:menaquinol-cytochrome c reductase iron-sulfur subunit